MKGSRLSTRVVTFAPCQHTRPFVEPYPKTGQEMWCVRCNAIRVVAGAAKEYRVQCQNCRVNRAHGAAKLAASHDAGKHARRCPTHTVLLVLGDTVIDRIRPKIVELSLPDDKPPF